MIYDFLNKPRKRHGNAWWVADAGFDPHKPPPITHIRGIRPYWVEDINGVGVRDPQTNEKVRIHLPDVAATKLISLNIEDIPEPGVSTDQEQELYDEFNIQVVEHIQDAADGAALIGAYYPWFNPRLAAMRTAGTLDAEKDELEKQWWGRIKRSRNEQGHFQSTSFFDRLHVLMTPVYGYSDLDPRDWLPELVDRMGDIDKQWIPHVWDQVPIPDRDGGGQQEQDVGDFIYILDTLKDAGVVSVLHWITGTGPFSVDENWYCDAINERFGDAA